MNRDFKVEEFLLPLDCCREAEKPVAKPLVIVCPGGGYTHISVREGVPVAKKFNALGFHSVVLRYAIAPEKFPAGLVDLCCAIKYYRDNADSLRIRRDRIIVCGFSAGGHLCACSGVFWDAPWLSEKIGCAPTEIKPDALCLCYPVITAGKFTHKGSFVNLIGGSEENYDESMYESVSLEKHVSANTPPTFLWHTQTDSYVPCENSLLFATELKKCGVPFALHIFSTGTHGISLATKQTSREGGEEVVPECQVWPELFKSFYETQFGGF